MRLSPARPARPAPPRPSCARVTSDLGVQTRTLSAVSSRSPSPFLQRLQGEGRWRVVIACGGMSNADERRAFPIKATGTSTHPRSSDSPNSPSSPCPLSCRYHDSSPSPSHTAQCVLLVHPSPVTRHPSPISIFISIPNPHARVPPWSLRVKPTRVDGGGGEVGDWVHPRLAEVMHAPKDVEQDAQTVLV